MRSVLRLIPADKRIIRVGAVFLASLACLRMSHILTFILRAVARLVQESTMIGLMLLLVMVVPNRMGGSLLGARRHR